MRLLLGLNVYGMEPVVPAGNASGKEIRCAMSVLPKVKRSVQNKAKKKCVPFLFSFALRSEILYVEKMKKKMI